VAKAKYRETEAETKRNPTERPTVGQKASHSVGHIHILVQCTFCGPRKIRAPVQFSWVELS